MNYITQYFRTAVAASSQRIINFKKEELCSISQEELTSGWIIKSPDRDFLWKNKEQQKEEDQEADKHITNAIIVLKTVLTNFEESARTENDLEEMTSIFFFSYKNYRTGTITAAR